MHGLSNIVLFLVLSLTPTNSNNMDQNEYILALSGDADLATFGEQAKTAGVMALDVLRSTPTPLVKITCNTKYLANIKHLRGVRLVAENTDVTTCTAKAVCYGLEARNVWGLDRIDQRMEVKHNMPNKKKYHFGELDDGENVSVYVADSGIDGSAAHHFGGRVRCGYGSCTPTDGHGTQIASVVGSSQIGVARLVSLVSVKVMNSSRTGSVADVIAGLSWILSDVENIPSPKKAVVALSICGPANEVLDDAVNDLITAGIPVVAAAGNGGGDACANSPGRLPLPVITVGATNKYDDISLMSNIGTCVNIFGPGEDVPAFDGRHQEEVTGTSVAVAHVTGVVARFLSWSEKYESPQNVWSIINRMATTGAVHYRENTTESDSPNKLVFLNCCTKEGCDEASMLNGNLILLIGVVTITSMNTLF